MLQIDRALAQRKQDLIDYFRERSTESSDDITRRFGVGAIAKRAAAGNKVLNESRERLFQAVLQVSRREGWTPGELLRVLLLATYASYVAMIETRNEIRPYEYMDFSRRVGELWEPFCRLCFDYPATPIQLVVPPTFAEIKAKLSTEVTEYIDRLNLTPEEKSQLKKYYHKVWALVESGEVNMELDLHFVKGADKINVDFKSGFGSNEKGNVNRLLLVGTIYKNLEENYRCVLLVRSEEDVNNNYFQLLRRSGVWEAYCCDEAYNKIAEFTGFQLRPWIVQNINWLNDLNANTAEHLQQENLDRFLTW